MEKILVVGVSGLVGSRIAELEKGDYEVYGTYNQHEVKGQNNFRLDTTSREATFRLVERIRPTYIIDTHAISNVDYCELHQDEAWNVNVDGARNLAEASMKYASKYVFFSTDYVFDGSKLSYAEKDKPHPLNYYAKTKLATEYILSALDANYLAIRTAVIYGKGGMDKVSFPVWVMNKLRNNEKITVVTDQCNKPTYADDLVRLVVRLCEKDEQGVFHATGRDLTSRYDFAKSVARTFNLDGKLISPTTSAELNQIAKRPNSLNLSTAKAERVTGLKPMGIDEGLKSLREQLKVAR